MKLINSLWFDIANTVSYYSHEREVSMNSVNSVASGGPGGPVSIGFGQLHNLIACCMEIKPNGAS